MKKKIIILPGDGIGKEVTTEGKKVLQTIAGLFDHQFEFDEAIIGHDAIESTGNPLPDETLNKLKNCDAILFGAVGHPKYDNDPTLKVRPEQGLLKMRKELGLYANLRPIKLFDELLEASSIKPEILRGSDILFFRELTGDVYFGEKGRKDNGNTAYDLMIYQRYEIERIAHKAFQAAQTRRKKLTSVDKANVLESSRLWREVVQEIGKQYRDVQLEHQFVDSAAMKLVQNPIHHAIASIARNPIFESIHQVMFAWLTEQRRITLVAPRQQDLALRAHQQIYAAIAAHDPDRAERMMRDHLLQVTKIYWKHRGADHEPVRRDSRVRRQARGN